MSDRTGVIDVLFCRQKITGVRVAIFLIRRVGKNRELVGPGNTKGGKYHCTVDLLFDWFGLVCFANKN
jgi:hypothetical protein